MPKFHGYGQFCPTAKAAEVICERWTPLIVRELLCGCTRFNEIRRGVPGISTALLSQRLRELVRAGAIVHNQQEGCYELTEAGRELWPIIESLGHWGKKWTGAKYRREELDPSILMMDMSRRLNPDALPQRKTVIHFEFRGAPARMSDYWFVLGDCEPDVCLIDPGFEVDLTVRTELRTMIAVWMGDTQMDTALRNREMELCGPPELRKQFPAWFQYNRFAAVPREETGTGRDDR